MTTEKPAPRLDDAEFAAAVLAYLKKHNLVYKHGKLWKKRPRPVKP